MALHLTLSLRAGARDAGIVQQMARAAERGRLDAVILGLRTGGTIQLDPLPLLGSLVGVTRQVGLAASWTVDFTEPYHVARVFATLDHLSYGRSAWVADMFGTDQLLPLIGKPREAGDLAAYCERAGEFIAVVKKLWDSWEDEGFALQKASGMFADSDRVHPINHAGRFFTVRGPLNVPRPPQGNPPLLLCDPESDVARRFVAATADVVLTDDPSPVRCRQLRGFANGRDIRVLINLRYALAETEAAAQQRGEVVGAQFAGTPAQLVELFAQCACDGFNLIPATLPDDLDLLFDVAIPLAQRKGLFRRDYRGLTLREHLALTRPRNQYAMGNAA
jgi:alkanesulfonate monooxygenase SsuD/methylene tetrahydromethanopterin reductase-like flavin-dependent oxidoreductase (luciferase family)